MELSIGLILAERNFSLQFWTVLLKLVNALKDLRCFGSGPPANMKGDRAASDIFEEGHGICVSESMTNLSVHCKHFIA